MATPLKVVVVDPISPRGIEELSRDHSLEVAVCTGLAESDLLKLVGDAHGIIVRSQTKITNEVLQAAKRLRVVGRRGGPRGRSRRGHRHRDAARDARARLTSSNSG